jgi:hypothetical protein
MVATHTEDGEALLKYTMFPALVAAVCMFSFDVPHFVYVSGCTVLAASSYALHRRLQMLSSKFDALTWRLCFCDHVAIHFYAWSGMVRSGFQPWAVLSASGVSHIAMLMYTHYRIEENIIRGAPIRMDPHLALLKIAACMVDYTLAVWGFPTHVFYLLGGGMVGVITAYVLLDKILHISPHGHVLLHLGTSIVHAFTLYCFIHYSCCLDDDGIAQASTMSGACMVSCS